MIRAGSRSRATAVFAASALTLHSLRYLLAPVAGSGALAHRHAYLAWVTPVAGLVLAVLLARALGALNPERWEGNRPRRGARAAALTAAVGLLVVFVGQEALESALTGAGVAELGPALGANGWVLIPLALGLGAVVSLVSRTDSLRPLPAALSISACRAGQALSAPATVARRPGRGLAFHLSGRAPPGALGS